MTRRRVERIAIFCKHCGTRRDFLPGQMNQCPRLFCSHKCRALFQPTRYWQGKKFSKEHLEKLSKSGKAKFKKGFVIWNKGLRGEKAPLYGSRNPMWKGGVSSINAKIRSSADFIEWRDAVFKRDNFTCIVCYRRSKKGQRIVINADHIKPFALFP